MGGLNCFSFLASQFDTPFETDVLSTVCKLLAVPLGREYQIDQCISTTELAIATLLAAILDAVTLQSTGALWWCFSGTKPWMPTKGYLPASS